MDEDIPDIQALEPHFHAIFGNRGRNMARFNRIRELLNQFNDRAPEEDTDEEDSDIIELVPPMIYTLYLFSMIPLPIIDFPVVWRRFRQRSAMQWVGAIMAFFSRQLVRLGWLIWYIAITAWWLEDLCKFISVFGSMATYSQGYFVDIVTYLLRDWPVLLERKADLLLKWGKNRPEVELESISQFLMDYAAVQVRASCSTDDAGQASCVLDTQSLIFRFSDAILRLWPFFGKLPTATLTSFTISLYLAYGIIAQFFGVNVLVFFCVHTAVRWLPSLRFFGSLLKLVWNHSEGVVW